MKHISLSELEEDSLVLLRNLISMLETQVFMRSSGQFDEIQLSRP